MILILDRPPTWKEELRQFFFKTAPGNFFGLPFYSVMLLLGKVDREIRKSISIAIAIGWAFVALVATAMVVFAPPDTTATYVMWSIVAFGTWAAVLAGSLIYNRINYGFYL